MEPDTGIAFGRMARAGARGYDRRRDLPETVRRRADLFEDMPEPVRTSCIVKRLSALEQAQAELRDEGSFAYSVNYHLAVAGALEAERRAYARLMRPIPRRLAEAAE